MDSFMRENREIIILMKNYEQMVEGIENITTIVSDYGGRGDKVEQLTKNPETIFMGRNIKQGSEFLYYNRGMKILHMTIPPFDGKSYNIFHLLKFTSEKELYLEINLTDLKELREGNQYFIDTMYYGNPVTIPYADYEKHQKRDIGNLDYFAEINSFLKEYLKDKHLTVKLKKYFDEPINIRRISRERIS